MRCNEMTLTLTTCTLPSPTVTVHPRYFRPTEVDLLLGNPAKAKRELGWAAQRDIDAIIAEMMENDMKSVLHVHQI